MDLIPRYLQAVKFWLPKQQQDDIIAELSEDIRAQVGERESVLGRPLTEPEIETILRQRGSPVAVANGYLPQRVLIGPMLFPVYLFVLKIVSLCILVPAFLGWLTALISRALPIDTGQPWIAHLADGMSHLWLAWFSALGAVTLLFAAFERTGAQQQILDCWNPRKLPPVRNPHSIPRSSSVIEIAVNLCVLVWWVANMAAPLGFHIGRLHIALTHTWTWFFWGVLLLTAASTAIAVVNLMRPWWTTRRVAARLILDAAGSVFFCSLLRAHIVAIVVWPGLSAAKAADTVAAVNLWLTRMFPWAIGVCIIIFAINAWRLIRVRQQKAASSMRTATV